MIEICRLRDILTNCDIWTLFGFQFFKQSKKGTIREL